MLLSIDKYFSVIMLLSSFSTGLIVPILSLLLLDKGITLRQPAIIIGIYSLTTIVIELPSGVFAVSLLYKVPPQGSSLCTF